MITPVRLTNNNRVRSSMWRIHRNYRLDRHGRSISTLTLILWVQSIVSRLQGSMDKRRHISHISQTILSHRHSNGNSQHSSTIYLLYLRTILLRCLQV